MKKGLIYVLVFALGAVLWTACSDEDDPLFKPEELNKEYGSSKTAALTLTYGNAPLTGKKVTFNTENSKTATITLTDVIPGEEQTTINNILLKEEKGKYVFSGQTTGVRAAGTTIDYDGSIADTVLNLNLNVTLADPQGWAKTYELGDITTGELVIGPGMVNPKGILSGALFIDWSTQLEGGRNMGIAYGGNLRGIGAIVLPQVIKNIKLEKDGNIRASYTSDEMEFQMSWLNQLSQELINQVVAKKSWQESPRNLAYWFEKDNKLYVKLNLPAIISQAMSDNATSGSTELIENIITNILNGNAATIKNLLSQYLQINVNGISDETFNTLLGWVKNGFPLQVKPVNGHTYIYLDQAALNMLFSSPVSPQDDPQFFMKSDFYQIKELVTPLIPQQYQALMGMFNVIPANWPITEKFDLGLDLVHQ